MSRRELTAVFHRVRFAFEATDEAEPPTLIIEATADGKLATLRGTAWQEDFISGCSYRFWGTWTTHPKYGQQFKFEQFVVERPAGEVAVTQYLKHAPRIGPALARRLWDAYGEQAVEQLRLRPSECAGNIKGLSVESAKEAAEYLADNAAIEQAKIELVGLLHGRGIPRKTADKLLQDYGSKATDYLKANPYLLMRYRGCGFLKADKLYIELGHNPARLKRQALCVQNAVEREANGDTWVPWTVARNRLGDELSGSDPRVNDAIRLMLRAKGLVSRIHHGQQWLAEWRKAQQEQRVAWLVVEAEEEVE